MAPSLYDVLVVPPTVVFRYLLFKPIAHVTYYLTLPGRYLFRLLAASVSFWIELYRSHESFVVFVGIAMLFGLILGGSLHFSSTTLAALLRAKPTDVVYAQSAKRSIADYRKQRKAKKLKQAGTENSHGNFDDGYGRGLTPQSILEEDEDSEF